MQSIFIQRASYLPEGVKVLIEIINGVLEELPKEITNKVN